MKLKTTAELVLEERVKAVGGQRLVQRAENYNRLGKGTGSQFPNFFHGPRSKGRSHGGEREAPENSEP